MRNIGHFDWTQVASFISIVAPLLVLGVTAILAIGSLVMWLTPSPVHRQRWGELTLIGAFIWALFALIPLPRLLPGLQVAAESHANPSHAQIASLNPANAPESEIASSNLVETGGGAKFLTTVDVNTIPEREVRPQLGELLSPEIEPFSAESQNQSATYPVPLLKRDSSVDIPRAPEVGMRTTEASSARAAAAVDSGIPAFATSGPSIPGATCLLLIYLTGSIACAVWLLIGQFLLYRIRSQRQDIEPWLTELFEHVVPRDTDRRLRVIVSPSCSRALSWGVLCPVIVLPVTMCRRGNECQIRTVLLHELGHVAQRDAWSNLLINVTMPVLYLHPLFWWMRVQMRLSAELLADDWAAQQTGKTQYVEELVALAKVATGRGILLPAVTGLFSSPSQFYRRMNMLLTREEPLVTRPTWTWRLMSLGLSASAVAIAIAIAGVGPAIGQQDPKPESAETSPASTDPKPTIEKHVEVKVESKETPDAPGVIVISEPGKESGEGYRAEIGVVPAIPDVDATGPIVPPKTRAPKEADEILKLRAELKRIHDRLKALGIESGPTFTNPTVANWPKGATITTTRIDDKGRAIEETWTVDEKGNREKLVVRTDTGKMEGGKLVPHTYVYDRSGLKPTDKVTSKKAVSVPPGKVTVNERGVAVIEEGNPVDPNSGVVIRVPAELDNVKGTVEIRAHSQPGKQPGYTVSGLESTAADPPVEVRQTMKGPNTSAASSQELDLVTLASSYADAVGAVESAKAVVGEIDQANSKLTGTFPQREVTTARIAFKNAERKEKLLRGIVTTALKRALAEHEYTAELAKKGYTPSSRVQDAEGRIEVLKQILESGSEASLPTTETKPSTAP